MKDWMKQWRRLLVRVGLLPPAELHYIGGSDTLPPPLSREREAELLERIGEEDARKELIEKFSALIAQNGGEVEKVDETWGKRRLAYAINDKPEGYYVLVTFKGPSELPREIERNMGISEDVLRCLIIKLEEKKHSVKPRPVRPAAPVAAPAEAAVEAAPAAAQPAETPAAE